MLDFRFRHKAKQPAHDFSGRRKFLVVFMMACMLTVLCRAIDLQVLSKQFLKYQGDVRQIDDVSVSANRGMIKDRNGAPLAVSTPVESIAISPRELKTDDKSLLKQMEKEFKRKNNIEKLTDRDKLQVLNDFHQERDMKIRKMEKLLNLPSEKIAELLNEEPA